MYVSRWWWAFLTTFDRNHDGKCSKSLTLKASSIRNLFTRADGECKILLRRSEAIVGKHPAYQLQAPASWQRSGSRVARFAAVFGFCEYYSHSPPSLLTGPRPLYFFLFPKMKLKLKGRHFDGTEEIQTESHDVMKTLTRNDFQQCFRSWKSRRDRYVHAEGDYFEWNGGE